MTTDAIPPLQTTDPAALGFVKPKLRGWLHAVMFPISVWAGIALVNLAQSPVAKVSVGIFVATAALMFGISAIYHIGAWRRRGDAVLHRLDHSNIFLLIAGSTTPFALLVDGPSGVLLLAVIWVGALAGVGLRIAWMSAPSWLYLPVYLALGCAPVLWFPAFWARDPATTILIGIGGFCYCVGALVYAIRFPNPVPRWFGFHEIFHVCTVAAFFSHCVGVAMIVQLPAM